MLSFCVLSLPGVPTPMVKDVYIVNSILLYKTHWKRSMRLNGNFVESLVKLLHLQQERSLSLTILLFTITDECGLIITILVSALLFVHCVPFCSFPFFSFAFIDFFSLFSSFLLSWFGTYILHFSSFLSFLL